MTALTDPKVLESLPAVLAALAFLGSIVGGAIGLTIRFLVFSDKRMERMVVSAFSSKPFVEAVERISVGYVRVGLLPATGYNNPTATGTTSFANVRVSKTVIGGL